MAQEWHLEGGAHVDCLSATHAIGVDFSDKWAEALGQALYYASETGMHAGIILVCKDEYGLCLRHSLRLEQAIAAYKLCRSPCGGEGRMLSF